MSLECPKCGRKYGHEPWCLDPIKPLKPISSILDDPLKRKDILEPPSIPEIKPLSRQDDKLSSSRLDDPLKRKDILERPSIPEIKPLSRQDDKLTNKPSIPRKTKKQYRCPKCLGKGSWLDKGPSPLGSIGIECPACDGNGYIEND